MRDSADLETRATAKPCQHFTSHFTIVIDDPGMRSLQISLGKMLKKHSLHPAASLAYFMLATRD